MKHATIILAGLSVLTACADSEPVPAEGEPMDNGVAGPATEAEPMPLASAPAVAGEGEVAPVLARIDGNWTSKREAGNRMALYGEPETEAAFSVRCEAGDLVFSRSVSVPEGPVPLTIVFDGDSERVSAMAQEDPIPMVTGRLPAVNAFAGALARAESPIMIQVPGAPTISLPPSDQFRTVVESCRA
ncbi:hypothetical protein B2G71_02500 [Novosphingobium sp. PC22D]|uniref:hypothetical protein n=1 Tax=Novosphingobium sp. PC22D TaxID=1962403 RepID=UPI000BEFAD00|nr:hypothetical protein [Novosphingobium sp. PC22D]PEQ14475.1 hypothetical protein B2G71_02500 [Novosphingobium sp. PC22D]